MRMNIKIEKYLKIFLVIKVMCTIDYTPYKLRDWSFSSLVKDFWRNVSKNGNFINLLEQNPHKIDWEYLSENPNAIPLLEVNPDKINWTRLSRNPNAIHLLEQNPDKIDWAELSRNENSLRRYFKGRLRANSRSRNR